MTGLKLQLLGPFEARLGNDLPVAITGKKAKALLAYLALANGQPVSRDKLAGVLWEFSADEQARTSLRQTLSSLRKCIAPLDGEALVSEGDTLAINPKTVAVDALDFEDLVSDGTPEALERASALYRGDLLDGMSLREEAFEAWLGGERARYRELALGALATLFRLCAEKGECDDAARLAGRLLGLDPLREDIHRALMRLYAEQGRRGLAVKQYEQCRDALRRELDVAPASETEALYEEIKEQPASSDTAAELTEGDKPPAASEFLGKPPPDNPSIAVLPFENLSGDPEQQYFSDGITSDIVTGLGRFRELFVIAEWSSFAYRDKSIAVQQVGRDLGVRHLLKGSVRAAGGKIRVSAQLVDATTGQSVWAENYDRVLDDVFAIQDEITQTIVATLAGRLEDAAQARALQKSASTLSVYDYLLRGRHHLDRGTKDDVLKARALFEQALKLDPNDARVYIELAEAYANELGSNWSADFNLAATRTFEFAQKAVELDDLDSRAHKMLAWAYYRVKGNYELAEARFETALALNPNYVWTYCAKGFFLTCSGRLDEGAACDIYALRLNPLMPDPCLHSIGVAHYLAKRYDEAIATFGKMADLPLEIQGCLAACYAQLGRDDEARTATAEFLDRADTEIAVHPGKDVERWHAYWLRLMPFVEAVDREHLYDGLRKAGLPV